MPSLKQQKSDLADSSQQLRWLRDPNFEVPSFVEKMDSEGLTPLKPTGVEIFQINLGRMCNQTCHHCHVDAGPDRREIMSRETLETCLELIKEHRFPVIDLTGGAPEMNPHFFWFVEEARKLGSHIMVRCNLTIILANEKYKKLPQFFKDHAVEVISSMPHYSKSMTDRQRGGGVFDKSIQALKMLNEVGYGQPGSDLKLNLVYNPSGAFLPGDQKGLELEFKKKLRQDFGIEFNHLFCITNMPISRYLEYLIRTENYQGYMEKLVSSFNPQAAAGVMCRNTLSIDWQGYIYDCDFNQMLDLKVETQDCQHISDFDLQKLNQRNIVLDQHCYGCTAGSGSSCGGETT